MCTWIALASLGISTIVVLGVVSVPMTLLQSEQPEEFQRIGGSYAPVLRWKVLPFSIYLALGDFKKNIVSAEVAASFIPAMWAARKQLLSAIGVLVCLIAT